MYSRWIILGLLPSLAWCTRTHESRQSAPAGYTLTGPAEPDRQITLRFALAQRDYEGLIDALYNVSTPSSPSYGHYLSAEEVCMQSARARRFTLFLLIQSFFLAGRGIPLTIQRECL